MYFCDTQREIWFVEDVGALAMSIDNRHLKPLHNNTPFLHVTEVLQKSLVGLLNIHLFTNLL